MCIKLVSTKELYYNARPTKSQDLYYVFTNISANNISSANIKMYKQTMKGRVIHKKFWMVSFINRLLNSCILYFPTLTILGGHTVFVRKRLASL